MVLMLGVLGEIKRRRWREKREKREIKTEIGERINPKISGNNKGNSVKEK